LREEREVEEADEEEGKRRAVVLVALAAATTAELLGMYAIERQSLIGCRV